MFVVMYKLRKPDLEIPVYDYFTIRPQWKEIRRILNIGIPSGIENSMFQFGKLAIQSTVSLMGMAAIAAQGMANLIENLNGILAIGVGVGLMTVVGESLGASRKDEAIYYVKKLSIVSEVVIVISCLVMYILVYPITKFGGMEAESARLCIHMVTWITIVKPVAWVFSFIPAYGFRAAGDVKFTMTVSVLSMWFCRVLLAMILARGFGMGPMAVWIGMFADWSVRGIIYAIRLKNKKMAESSGNRLKKNNFRKKQHSSREVTKLECCSFFNYNQENYRKRNCIIPSFMVGFKTVIVIILNKSEGDRYDKYSKRQQ